MAHTIIRKFGTPLLVAALGLALAACGGSDDDVQTKAPTATAPQPGQLLTAERLTETPALADASENFLITYMSTGISGRNVVVSGQVAIPKGTPPVGGFPVVSYAWGTNGLADICSPSNAGSAAVRDYLNMWIKRGYAVLQTDYEGWGTPGKPGENGRSNGYAVANIVTAAHAVSDKLSNDWIALGHSLGGGAVIWTAGLMQQTGGKYNLKGAIADAPVGPGIYKFITDVVNGAPIARASQPFVSIVALAAQVNYPSIKLEDVIAEPMLPQVAVANTRCIGEMMGQPQLQPGQYYKPGPTFDLMAKYVKEQDASSLTLKVPLFVVQAGNDQTTVTPETTKAMVKSLCTRSTAIQYKEYPGESHGSVAVTSIQDAFSFAAAALAGNAPKGACS